MHTKRQGRPHLGRLVAALRVLADHREEIDCCHRSVVGPRVGRALPLDRKLLQAFAACVSDRRGATLKTGRDAVKDFDKKVPELIRIVETGGDPERTHRRAFELMCGVRNVNQKIAANYLRHVVDVFGEWHHLRPHLFVPLDRVVLRLLRVNLQVCDDLPKQSLVITGAGKRLCTKNGEPVATYKQFLRYQGWFTAAAKKASVDRILVDGLWVIGHIFCQPYPLCHTCWIREHCAARRQNEIV